MTLSYSPYSLDVFSGSFDGHIEMGANLKGDFSRFQLTAGDQLLQIVSPVYGDQSRGFYARGASISVPFGKRTKLLFFGGAAGNTSGSQLFELVRPDQAIGAVQLEYEANRSLSLFSRSLFDSRQSVISGFDFHPSHRYNFGAQGGIGSNTPYAAFTGAYKGDATSLEASYVASKPQFRLVQLNALNYQEPINENLHVHHKFDGTLQFDYRRTNFQFNASNGALSQFSGNNIFLNGRLGRTGWNAGYNQVSGEQRLQGIKTLRDSQQVNFGLNQSFGHYRISAFQYRQISASGQSSLQNFTTIMAQEPIGRWVLLRQIVNHSNNWGVAYGGEIHNNWINLSVDYQTTYNLFQSGPTQFTQGVVVEGDLNLPGGAKLFANTNVTPDGRFLYSWGLRASFTGPYGRGTTAGIGVNADDAPQMPRFVVRGKVLDATTGTPVADFPVNVGPETAFTNEAGEFSVRLFSGRALAASPDTTTPHQGFEYEFVEGPKQVRPSKSGANEEYVWKIKRGHAAAGSRGLLISDGSDKTNEPPAPSTQLPGNNP